MEKTSLKLEETFSSNFISYYRSHSAHLNIVGRNFYQDHKLLEKIYQYFQSNIDTLGEKIRSVRGQAPDSLGVILQLSTIADRPVRGSSEDLLMTVLDAVDLMMEQYEDLYAVATEEKIIDIQNFAQDAVGQLAKFRWMIEATLNEEGDDDER
jgi:DNA-binding ferritin-like protein